MAQTVSEIIASGDDRVYKLRGNEAISFLNLLQEVGKLRFFSSVVSKYIVFGSFGTFPSLGGNRNSASSQPRHRECGAIRTTNAPRLVCSERYHSFFASPHTNLSLNKHDNRIRCSCRCVSGDIRGSAGGAETSSSVSSDT
jgi:hypothetical protein